jgi:asparagine synthase (glutamine-hydrolysing)
LYLELSKNLKAVTCRADANTKGLYVKIIIREKFGWNLYKTSNIKFWFSGYLTKGLTVSSLLDELVLLSKDLNIEVLSKLVRNISGHFSMVVQFSDDSCFLAVDKICSIPIFDVTDKNKYAVSNYAPFLKSFFSIDKEIDLRSLLEISMSGFTIGNKTIYQKINRLMAGECVLWKDGKKKSSFYYTYFPAKIIKRDYNELKNKFAKVCLLTIKNLIDSIDGRQIVVPLSAGKDSRLIVSCLKELSYENVVCFTYGRLGNYEVSTSQKVAAELGYRWIYVQDTWREKRNFFKSSIYDLYVKEFESYASVPNVQDIYEVYTLKSRKIIDNDAVIVNGNSGDFISGSHVPKILDLDERFLVKNDAVWDLFLEKHYSIWRKLRNNLNDKIIISGLNEIILNRYSFKKEREMLTYAVFESMECIGRQSRLVANQQRSYEFVGHEWRLPLWSEDFLDFWERVDPKYKINQKLYNDVLIENDWGGVWKNVNVNNKLIRPHSLRFARLFVKILVAPFGKTLWHSVEKNVFIYWTQPTYTKSVASYWSVLFDMRGQRNTNSWTADQFIKTNGFSNGVIGVSDKMRSQVFKIDKKSS